LLQSKGKGHITLVQKDMALKDVCPKNFLPNGSESIVFNAVAGSGRSLTALTKPVVFKADAVCLHDSNYNEKLAAAILATAQ